MESFERHPNWKEYTLEDRNTFLRKMGEYWNLESTYGQGITDFISDSFGNLPWRISTYIGVKVSDNDSSFLTYYESKEKRGKGIRTKVKPGKLFRKLCPWASDSQIESAVAKYAEHHGKVEYDIFCDTSFGEVYSTPCVSRPTPDWDAGEGYILNSLSSSCMRHEKEYWGFSHHPAEVYNSGDFKIVYAKEKKSGKIGARVIVGNNSASKIYTACDIATKAIVEYLKNEGIDGDSSFEGLSLSKLKIGPDKYLMCYVDGYSYAKDKGDSLVIDESGDIGIQTQSGYILIEQTTPCDQCNHCVPESDLDSAILSYGERGLVCCDCREGPFFMYSYIQHIHVHVDSGVQTAHDDWVSEEYANENCVEYDSEYFLKSDPEIREFKGNYYHKDSDEYKVAIGTYEKKTEYGFQWVYKREYGSYLSNPVLEYAEKVTITLRHNYQINADGMPERLPELPLDLTDLESIDSDFEPIN